tara:strand:+ start:71 stop:589 length:519 start_codon:yes stop_codon:yes gene_type:complete
MSPKYVMFIIPLIIIWIILKIDTINIKISAKNIIRIILIFTLIFFLINVKHSPIDRPPTKILVEKILDQNIPLIVTTENDVFNNYLRTQKKIVQNNIIVLREEDAIPNNLNNFWLICLNNPRFAVGDKGLLINNPKIEAKCLNFSPVDKNFKEILPIINDTQDYLIRKFEKK